MNVKTQQNVKTVINVAQNATKVLPVSCSPHMSIAQHA